MKFTHLHVHSHYSVLDGMSKVPDLVDKAIKLGMPAIALTDHGCMYGIKELLDYCKKANKKLKEKAAEEGTEYVPFKPIVGVEAYCARRSRLQHDKELKAINAEGKTYIVDQSGWHLILLAKNMQGYRNLCKIVSASFMEDSYYRRPRIDKELLEQYHEGLVCCSACLGGELPQKIMEGLAFGSGLEAMNEAEKTIEWFKGIFGEDYYIEIQRHQTTKEGSDQHVYQVQKEVNPVLVELAKKHGVKVVATNDVHFVEEEHAEAHDHLVCVSTNHFIDDDNRMHYTKQEWLKSPAEMEAIFSDIPEALENTQEIVDKVEIYDIDSGPLMPKFPIPEEFGTEESYRQKFTEKDLFEEFTRDENGNEVLTAEAAEKKVKTLGGYDRLYRIKLEADYLAHLAYKGAHERYGETLTEEQEERIKFELHIMKTMGFPGYFLIVMDFIRAAREELGVSVGPGRGSAAGSVVAYCLRITDLDPLKYDLLFERFLNPDRISLPDIDTDFDDAGRGKVLDWVSDKYGHTQVAHIITYGTMATKSAIADVGRVQRIPLARVNEIKGLIPEKSFPDNIKDEKGKSPKVNLQNCYKYVDDLRALLNGDEPQIRNMLTYAAQLEDTIRQVGVHACGVIIGADDLTKFAPLSTVEDKTTGKRVLVTEYDGHVVESVGLIKMDFLGLKTLTIIKECLKNIYKAHGVTIDIDHISIEDAETYKLFQEGRTVGVFQFESAGMRKYMKELKPTVMGDLIAMNALYRPGPMDYIPQFIRRKHGLEPVTYDIPVMEKYLKDTYGVTVYQEQVMLLSRLLANFTRGESDQLRKAMGKKIMKMLEELKPKFINGGKSNGHNEKTLEKIWADWEKFASYAFNKSHAACYSWVAYQTAYLKAHYPAEFMAANLTVAKDDIKDVTKFMDECKAMKISVLAPDVNESEMNFTVNSKGDIRFGLGGVKGVGEGAVEAIIQEREKNGKYKDLFDFLERVNLQACNRKTVESLALAGAFDGFEGLYREQLFASNAKGENMLEVVMRYGNRFQQDKQERSISLFDGFDIGGIEVQRPELPVVPRWSAIERLNKEKDLIGIFLSAHPLDEWEFEVKELCNTTAEEMQQFDAWTSPAARASASTHNEENGEEEEEQKEKLTPNQWLEKHAGQPLHLGGIIVAAEDRMSQKGNPWGKYTIEDYTGSYQFSLFGEAYQRFAAILRPNMYVYLSGIIQQRGAHMKWFKPKPLEEAEYEFAVQQVQLIKEAQKDLRSITLQIPIENVQPDLIDELMDITKQYPGETSLRLEIFDTIRQNVITFNASPIQMSSELYGQLKELQTDGILSYKIN